MKGRSVTQLSAKQLSVKQRAAKLRAALPVLPGGSEGEDPRVTWRNWAGNQSCTPSSFERPHNEAQLQKIVSDATRAGSRVRVAASGHSFTGAALSSDVLISMERISRVRSVDRLNRTVTVDGGMPLTQLNEYLANVGLAMTNLGDIAYQTVAGAICTGTHGTGLGFGGLATQVRGLRLVTAAGDIVEATPFDNPALFHAARVSLGVLGILSQVTLAVEPAFNLHAVEKPLPVEEVFATWTDRVGSNDHFEFLWIPGTDTAATKTNRRTTEPAKPMGRAVHLRDKILGENVAFGAMAQTGRVLPSLIPRLARVTNAALSTSEYIDRSDRVFTSPRWVRFLEMEYSLPVDDIPVVAERIGNEVVARGLQVLFPIEGRAVAADDIPLSTATARDSGYLAVHVAKGRDHTEYFSLVESIMKEHDGRPHWGKLHTQTAETLAPLYPQWEEFQRVRQGVDPTGLFSNDYTDRVLGRV